MFRLAKKYTVDRLIPKCDFIRQTPQSKSIVNDENKQIYIDIPREDIAFLYKTAIMK